MDKTIIIAGLSILLFLGCTPPSTSSSNSPGGTPQQAASQLKPTTVNGVELQPTNPVPGLEILIPESFSEMDAATIATKYPGANRPTLVYTNETGAINIAINHTQDKISPKQLTQLHQQLDTSIRQAHPKANWMFSGFQHYHGRKWAQLEFQSDAVDAKIHNMMLATSAQGRMLLVTFNCTDEHASDWLDVGREIVKSAIFTD